MSRLFTVLALALVAVGASPRPALSAPPTVTPSPGYDARLQEQRKAMSASSPGVAHPVAPVTANAPRYRSKRKR